MKKLLLLLFMVLMLFVFTSCADIRVKDGMFKGKVVTTKYISELSAGTGRMLWDSLKNYKQTGINGLKQDAMLAESYLTIDMVSPKASYLSYRLLEICGSIKQIVAEKENGKLDDEAFNVQIEALKAVMQGILADSAVKSLLY